MARIELPNSWVELPHTLLQHLLHCISLMSTNATTPQSNTVLHNTMWTLNALVKEWKSVKLQSGAAVMASLEDDFTEPALAILQRWGSYEMEGQEDWTLNEAGRYAFKSVSHL